MSDLLMNVIYAQEDQEPEEHADREGSRRAARQARSGAPHRPRPGIHYSLESTLLKFLDSNITIP